MTVTNGYCEAASVMAALGLHDARDLDEIELAIETASRMIDAHTNRRFWQDTAPIARTYFPSEYRRVYVDDISTTTGLEVKVDLDDTGTYETTLTIGSDFIVEPVNADKEYPVRPFESIKLLDGRLLGFSRQSSGRPFVQVTARYGWTTIPTAVKRACMIQARHVWKAAQTHDALLQVSVDGTVIRQPVVDPMARVALEPFIRYTQVDNHG